MIELFRDELAPWVSANAAFLVVYLLLTLLMIFPLLDHFLSGWWVKHTEIDKTLSQEAKRIYLLLFQREEVPIGDASRRFDEIYRNWYGRHRLIVPILLVLLASGLGDFYLAKEIIRLAGTRQTPEIGPAAVAGAYTFVAFDFFSRVQRRNLSIADIVRGALRLAIAIPLGYAFAAVAKPDVGVFIAFGVGIFPLNTVSTILRQLLNKKLELEIGAAEGASQVVKLSGVDAAIADRIEDADVTTIAQLAWCDPVQLTMRTNLDFDYIVDICSQALAWVYLDNKLDEFRKFGLRGAYEIRALICDDLKGNDPELRAIAERLLPIAATATDIDVTALRYAFDQIAYDPYTEFLYSASDD